MEINSCKLNRNYNTNFNLLFFSKIYKYIYTHTFILLDCHFFLSFLFSRNLIAILRLYILVLSISNKTMLVLHHKKNDFWRQLIIDTKAPFSWSENRKDEKGRVENREENDVLPCLVQKSKHKRWKILGKKIHPGPQIFILLIWEEK